MAAGRARIRVPLAELGQGILKRFGKVRVDKVYSGCTNKNCHDVIKYSKGPLKIRCATNFDLQIEMIIPLRTEQMSEAKFA